MAQTTNAAAAAAELNLIEELFTKENLIHAISGATGGIVAISVFFPLNNVRMRLQVDDSFKTDNPFVVGGEIMKRDGIGALYQGWWSSVVSLGASNFVYFYAYNAFKTYYQVKILGGKNKAIDPFTNLAIAAVAGVINVFGTTPLWVVGTRLAVQTKAAVEASAGKVSDKKDRGRPYEGILDCITRIANEEGVLSLWKGVGPSLVLVSNPSIQFVSYEWLRRPVAAWAARGKREINAAEFFIIGAISKAIATFGTYPLQVAQSKLRADRGHGDPKEKDAGYTSTIDCLYKILKKDGLAGWFKGLQAKLWQTVLTAAFQFLVYEKISAFITGIFLPKLLKVEPKKAH